jgi:flagellar hook-basal body complex protein FliE
MSVSGIEAIGGALTAMPATPAADYLNDVQNAGASGAASGAAAAAGVDPSAGASTVNGASSANGAEFGNLLSHGIDQLENLQNTSSNLSVQAATGDLNAIHDYTIAAAEASTATQLTVSLRNTALQSFNSIMNMQV